jgi:hypothetical protein
MLAKNTKESAKHTKSRAVYYAICASQSVSSMINSAITEYQKSNKTFDPSSTITMVALYGRTQ